MSTISVNWPRWNRIINERFVPLTKARARYWILYGGRGSSKSDFISKKLIFHCLTDQYFKCIIYRKKYNTIQESSYETIKQNIISLGLESLFTFRVSPLSITCINGNRFIARGGDDPKSLKSIKDPTCVWYEEEPPDEADFATISLTIRSMKADRLEEYFTINPEVEGSYEDHWFWRRFFKGHTDLSYTTRTEMEWVENGMLKQAVYDVIVHHSTYADNRWLPDTVKAAIEGYRDTNEYLYSIYAKGLWCAKETGGNFYADFSRVRHVSPEAVYDPSLPIHVSFDFNVRPGMHCIIGQIKDSTVYIIAEIQGREPDNKTERLCRLIRHQFIDHAGGMVIYGDPAGRAEDTRAEKGHNDYYIILKELSEFRPTMRVAHKHPSVKMRGQWLNAIFSEQFDGINVLVSPECGGLINDFMYVKENPDNTKFKEKVKDAETKITYERYGHYSDCYDYLMCEAFVTSFQRYQKSDGINTFISGTPRKSTKY